MLICLEKEGFFAWLTWQKGEITLKNFNRQESGKLRSSIIYGVSVAAAAAFWATPVNVWAASAVPAPGESIERPQVSDNQPVVAAAQMESTDASAGTHFQLQSVTIRHENMKLKDAELNALTTELTRHEIGSAELNAVVDKITTYARSHGYPAALAYIPEQTAVEGNLTLAIEPGRFDTVTVETNGVMQERLAKGYLAGLKQGEIIRTKKLEKALRNLRDIPGIAVNAVLAPGSSQGTSNLKVTLNHHDRDSYVVYAENYGSRAAGRYRYGVQADWRNLEGSGSRINVGGLISNANQHGYNVGFETPLGHSATMVGIGYSYSDYELGSIWSQLGVKGFAHTISLYGKTPLQNTAANGLNVIYAYNYRKLNDEFNGTNIGDRHSHSFSLGLNGRNRTQNNALQYNVTLHTGTLSPDSAVADTLATAGGTKGRFTKGTLDATAVQKLGGPFDVMLKLSGQKAASNLDSSEHIYLGGARGVRAYPQGEASGDEGLLGTLELRYHTQVPGLTLSTYFDAGSVKTQKSVSGSTTLKGWGIGLTYSKPNDWFARLDYARRIGFADNLSRDANSKQRMWFILGKIF